MVLKEGTKFMATKFLKQKQLIQLSFPVVIFYQFSLSTEQGLIIEREYAGVIFKADTKKNKRKDALIGLTVVIIDMNTISE